MGGAPESSISREQFYCVYALVTDPRYAELEMKRTLTAEDWQFLLDRILPKAARWLGLGTTDDVPYRNAQDFDQLRRRWAKSVIKAIHTITYSWMERVT